MHSSRMLTARSLTISRCIPHMPPSNHTCPLQPFDHACPPTMHTPPQPCTPLATMHSPWQLCRPTTTMHAPWQPCISPGNHTCPPSNHAHPTKQPIPPTNHTHPPPATTHAPPSHTLPNHAHPLPPCGQTDTCKNITFANFFCGR